MKKLFFYLVVIFWLNISNTYSQSIPESRFKFLTNIGLEFERPSEYTHVIDVCASPYFLTPDPNGDPIDEIKPAGIYEIQFDASDLTSGLYIYKMQTADYSLSKKNAACEIIL